MTDEEFDAFIQREYPSFPYGEPMQVTLLSDPTAHYACRLCIARRGLRGDAVLDLPTDIEAVRAHIKLAHVIVGS